MTTFDARCATDPSRKRKRPVWFDTRHARRKARNQSEPGAQATGRVPRANGLNRGLVAGY